MRKNILILTGLKLIASVIGLTYSILQVRFFGASAMVDTFFVAMAAVTMITSLMQSGQLAEVFLPEYLKQKLIKGSKAAHDLLSVVINRLLVFVFASLLLIYFAAPFVLTLLGPGLASKYRSFGVEIFQISLVAVLFTVISSFVTSTLNAEEVFGRAELTAIVNSVLSLVLLLLLYKSMGIYVLIISMLVGKLVEFLMGVYFLHKIGYKYRIIWRLKDYDILPLFKTLFTTSTYVGATQLYASAITAMASFLPAGSLSIYNYVLQLSNKGSSIIMGPISTVFFSKIAKIVVKQRDNLESHIRRPFFSVFAIYFIIFCFILIVGNDFLHLLWNKRSLTEDQFLLAYWMLCLNFFGYLFSSTGYIFRKLVVAIGEANLLYRYWTFIQIFSAAYTVVAIYFGHTWGLASVLVVNMISLSMVSFVISAKNKVNTKLLFTQLFFTDKNFIFLSVTIAGTLLILFLLNFFQYGFFVGFLIKALLLSIVIGSVLLSLYKSELLTNLKNMISNLK